MLLCVIVMASCTRFRGYKNDGKKVTFHSYDSEFLIPYSKEVHADPNTFEALSDIYGRDKYHVFFWGDVLEGVDAATFRIVDIGDDYNYTADKDHVYQFGFIIENADPATFRIISKDFAEDKNDYFWRNKSLKVVDKGSFVLVPDSEDPSVSYWGKDKYNAYNLPWHVSVPIKDYDSFRAVSARYALDSCQVYHRGSVVEGADPTTFKEILWDFGQDKNGIYYKHYKTDLDPNTTLENDGVGKYFMSNGRKIDIWDLKHNYDDGSW